MCICKWFIFLENLGWSFVDCRNIKASKFSQNRTNTSSFFFSTKQVYILTTKISVPHLQQRDELCLHVRLKNWEKNKNFSNYQSGLSLSRSTIPYHNDFASRVYKRFFSSKNSFSSVIIHSFKFSNKFSAVYSNHPNFSQYLFIVNSKLLYLKCNIFGFINQKRLTLWMLNLRWIGLYRP